MRLASFSSSLHLPDTLSVSTCWFTSMDTSLRIPCIGEHSLLDEGIATDPPLVYFSHLLFDMSGSVTSNDPVRLDNLHQLRQGIINTRPNAALESPEQTRAELLQAVGDGSSSWPTRILAVDITSNSEGRSPAGLYDAHGGAVQIGYSTCPCDTDEESSNFLRELTHGLKISSSVCFPNTVYVKVDEEISSECKARLQACGAIHKFPRTKSVPILVEISGFENDSALLVVSLLESCGVDLSRVCLVGIVPSMSRIESIKLILEKTPCFVCFHSVGNIISPPVGPILPTDEEIVAVLVALKGYHAACLLSRVILSMNINCKIKMRGYGGPGQKTSTFSHTYP